MKALQFAKTGSLDHLTLTDLPKPVPKAGEVLVKIEAAGLNPSDVKNVLGRFPYTTLPRVPGRDFAGVVVEGPQHLLGRDVFGTGKELGFTRDGTHGEFVVVPESGIVERPSALSRAQAGTCGVPYVTAWDGLTRANADAGSRVAIIGAGAVGRAAADLARWRGADVVLMQRGQDRVDALAAEDYQANLLDNALPLAGQLPPSFETGADVIFDTTGALIAQSVPALATHGRIIVIAAPGSGRVEFPVLDLYRRGGTLVGVNSLLHDTIASAPMLKVIARGWQSGRLKLPQDPQSWPFADALAAYRAANEGGAGKLVFTNI